MFRFVTLTLEIPEKTNFHRRIFCKIVLHTPLGNPNSNNQDPWKFHMIFFFDHPLEFKHALSSISLEIPGPQTSSPSPPSPPLPLFAFFLERNSTLKFSLSTCGGNLCKMAKNCMTITKSTLQEQNIQVGHMGDQANFWVGETLFYEFLLKSNLY